MKKTKQQQQQQLVVGVSLEQS